LPISTDDTIAVADLPVFKDHGDPFDRLIVTQCRRHNLALISSDNKFDRYGINRIWS
jgi:PIN domain nuclease of toxin-antitoxin system